MSLVLPVDVLQDDCNRMPRKLATLHINRHWDQIVALAEKNDIPLCDVAVRIICTKFPFEIHVFDYHEFLGASGQESHLAMVANKILGRPGKDRRDSVMVVIHMPEIEFPFIASLVDTWMRDVSINTDNADSQKSSFVDQDGNALSCKNYDALRAGVCCARKYAIDLDIPVWSETVLNKATNNVMDEFEEEMNIYEDTSDSDYDESIE